MDKRCPNIADHGNSHLIRRDFLAILRIQLAIDRGNDADYTPLYFSGSRGSLFKVRLSLHGYTLVAKGVEEIDAEDLRHENAMYDHV